MPLAEPHDGRERGLKSPGSVMPEQEGVVFPLRLFVWSCPRGRLWIVCQSREKVRLLAAFFICPAGGGAEREAEQCL